MNQNVQPHQDEKSRARVYVADAAGNESKIREILSILARTGYYKSYAGPHVSIAELASEPNPQGLKIPLVTEGPGKHQIDSLKLSYDAAPHELFVTIDDLTHFGGNISTFRFNREGLEIRLKEVYTHVRRC